MKLRQNWLFLVVFLVFISLFLVACERPLPGGYNEPSAPPDTTVPGAPVDVPEVDSENAYPAEEEPAAPANIEEAYPADAAQPAEGEGEQGLTTGEQPAGEEAAPESDQTETTETEEQAAEEAPDQGEASASPEASGEAAAPAEESELEETAETPGTHTVAAGENLYRIGLLYGINWVDLAQANGITDPTSLYVGQVLILPGSETEVEGAAEESGEVDAAEETEAVEETGAEAAEPGTYTVLPGDTLNKIGALLGVDWTEIAALNGIVGTQIYAGQVLIIPVPGEASTEPVEEEAPGEETTYVVQEGDTVYSVAFENNIPWTLLVTANNIEAPYTLELGQTLIIPAGE